MKGDFKAAAALYQPPDRQEDVNASEHRWACRRKKTFYLWHCRILLCFNVPKRGNFSLAFFTLSESIRVGDLGTEPKNPFFYHLTPDFERFWFFAAY